MELSKHTSTEFNARAVDVVRTDVNNMANFIEQSLPPGRRKAIALTKLEEFSMWAVKAITLGDDV